MNFILHSNKASSCGESLAEKDINKRALVLDEADSAYFDLYNKHFNISVASDSTISNIPWVYDLLVDFFATKNTTIMHAYYNYIDDCTQKFLAFANGKLDNECQARLAAISHHQLELWQESAVIALRMKYNKDFVIASPIDVMTKDGAKTISKAHLIIHNQEDYHSRSSSGVGQCLHAWLNRLKKYPENITSEPLREALTKCQHDFYVEDEKQIIYSSSSKDMLDEYKNGYLYALTGSAGSPLEREEAKKLYDTQLIEVPRHKQLNRIDKPTIITKNYPAQCELMITEINAAIKRKQPILVMCEDDAKSLDMYKYLTEKLPQNSITRINAQYDAEQEAKYINNTAGEAGQITVSTSKIGRGTDIPLHNSSKEHGLYVLIDSLPRARDYKQMIGRAGRFGAIGSSRMILNKQALKKTFNKSTLTDGFYTATEEYIQKQQAIMDRTAQVERLIKYTVYNFRYTLTKQYFESFLPTVHESNRQALISAWQVFYAATNTAWIHSLQNINSQINVEKPDTNSINLELKKYRNSVKNQWAQLIDNSSVKTYNSAQILTNNIGDLELSEETKKLMNSVVTTKLKTSIYTYYDPSHDGMATIYTSWFVKTIATLRGERRWFADFFAWYNGHGILFPNLRALLKGHMTISQYLFGAHKPAPIAPEATAEPAIPQEADCANNTTHETKILMAVHREGLNFFSSKAAHDSKTDANEQRSYYSSPK